MCGICGIFNLVGKDKIDKDLLKRMSYVLKHRGPDDSGIYSDSYIGLAHRRLSIIDLSKAGHQPMCNEDHSIWIVYNGEVYNFKELRADLEKKGHRFSSNTDTEVIIHSYEEYGENCLALFNGMFAFAIWDSNKKKLFLARDRIGIKPLYYALIENKLLFASEIKAILQYKNLKRALDHNALHKFLTFRYVPGEDTLFENIKKIKPGHYMVFKKNKITTKKYWEINNYFTQSKKPESYYTKELFRQLKESVKKRLIADVPLGMYLSGGIDSASIVGLMSTMLDEPVKTFSIGFGAGESVDEFNEARQTSLLFKTDHHEIMVKPDISKYLPLVTWHLDAPYEPISIVNHLLSKLATKKVKVILSGEGADESFAGYIHHKSLMANRYLQAIPSFIRKSILANTLKLAPISLLDKLFNYPSSLGEAGKQRFIDLISSEDLIAKYLLFVSNFHEKEKRNLYSADFNKEFNQKPMNIFLKEEFNKLESKKPLNKILSYEFKSWLPNAILHVADGMTMSNSIEGRVPFLDYNLVQFTSSIPSYLKLRMATDKYIFRKAMRKLLPKEIVTRKKHAFFMPLDSWFKHELKDIATNVFSEKNVKKRGIFNHNYIQHLIKNYPKSKLVYGRQIVTLLTIELWHRMYIDNNIMKKPGKSIDRFI